MADILVDIGDSTAKPRRFKDMGDGTYAEVVAVGDLVVTADTINLDTADIEAKLGIVTEAAPATDTASSGLNGRLQRLAQKLTAGLVAQLGTRTTAQSPAVNIASDDAQIGTKVTAITALADGGTGLIGWLSQIWDRLNTGLKLFGLDGATVASAANPVPVAGSGAWTEADATLTRPANATATVARGSIGSAASCLFKFTNFFDVNGQHSLLDGMKMVIEKAALAVPAGIAIRVHLYQDDETGTVLSANADAATFKTMAAAAGKKIGYVDFTTWSIGGAGSDCIESYGVPVLTSLHLKAAAGARDLYGIAEASAVYTPINAGIHHLYASRVGL